MINNINRNWDFTKGSTNINGIFTPWYITGFSDGEGSFQITIQDLKGKGLTGFKPFLEFKITQKNDSVGVLFEIQKFFNCGRICIDNRKSDTMKFVITNVDDLVYKLVPHFDKYQLVTSKYLNYIDFKSALILLKNKEHFKYEGIQKLKLIKSTMNKARSFEDKYNYCLSNKVSLDPSWLQGFIDGEGSFQCEIGLDKRRNSSKNTINFSLQIKQNSHDVAVLNHIKKYLKYGFLKPKYNTENIKVTMSMAFTRKTTVIWIRNYKIICKFFDQYPLYTLKWLDYLDWKRLIRLKESKAHLNRQGLILMKYIKANMNANRVIY